MSFLTPSRHILSLMELDKVLKTKRVVLGRGPVCKRGVEFQHLLVNE